MWLLGSGALGLVAGRLYWLGLHRKYPFFFAFLLFRTARTLTLLLLSRNRQRYALVFLITQPVVWASYVLVVHELYSLVLQGYQGIRSLGRRALYGGLAIGVFVSATSLILSWEGPIEAFPILIKAMQLERGVAFSLVVFLIIIAGFLVVYPVPLNRNVTVHTFVYFVYFLTLTGVLLVRQMGGAGANAFFRSAELGVSVVCASIWLFFISRRGEETVLRRREMVPAPASEKRLLDTLEAFNTALLRAGGLPARTGGGAGGRHDT